MAEQNLYSENGYEHGTLQVVKINEDEAQVRAEIHMQIERSRTKEFKEKLEELINDFVL